MVAPLRLVPKIITIDRDRFRMRVWKMHGRSYYKEVAYHISVGALGHATPSGLYIVDNKSRTPDWRAPNADWVAVADRGKVFKFADPKNPFEGGFISFGQGLGFHGTKFNPKIGSRASHGCIRMVTNDFLKLYGRVPIGTPVFVY